jgi:capsular exopolysaccharide synthesis family protein
MSRVDEAMRRAAEGPKGDKEDVGVLNPDGERNAEPLADEAFPDESPDRQPLHPDATPRRHFTHADATSAPSAASHVPSKLTFEPEESAEHRSHERFAEGVFEKIVGDRRMPAVCREQYRRLAAVLHDAQATNRTQVVMVASAVAGEGKTLTAANIALTLSSSYRKRVLVIDADLRRPTMHKVFRIEASSGLTDGLDPSANKSIVVRQITPRLALLPAGRPLTDPMAGLISPRMRQLIDEARETFDWVIIDTPPLVLLPDANLLASMVDAAVLVVRAESTPHAMVKRAMDAIGRSRLMGVVLNSATVGPHGAYDSYGYDYAPVKSEIVSP